MILDTVSFLKFQNFHVYSTFYLFIDLSFATFKSFHLNYSFFLHLVKGKNEMKIIYNFELFE